MCAWSAEELGEGDLMFGSNRVNFEKILEEYRGYLYLYRYFNYGSLEGCAPFIQFYWNHRSVYNQAKYMP
jgi:hypothetical protein